MEGNLSLNAVGVILTFSASLEQMLGYASDEVIGRDFSSLAPAGAEEDIKNLLEAVKNGGAAIAHYARFEHKDNSPIGVYLSVYPLRDSSGRLYSYLVSISREKTQEQPAFVSQEFQRIFRCSNDAVCVTDRSGRIMDVNQAFLKLYGYEKDDVLGKNPRIIKSEHTTKEQYESMWADILNEAKGFWQGQIINKKKDGTEVPVLISINAIKDEAGEIRNFLAITFDLTEHIEKERLGRIYVDYMVHDIRGPLTSIMSNAELLIMQHGASLPEKAVARLAVILEGSKKINNMACDMLDYSRAQKGRMPLSRDRVRFSDLIDSAISPFEGAGKRLVLNNLSALESVNAEIEVDAEKLRRAIYNILSNAFKHASKEVRMNYELNKDGLKVTVTDDGTGLKQEQAQRVFEPFYQTKDGIKAGGAGLGLSIVKSFVELHGGRVWVEGAGKGAAFGFFIPLQTGP